MTRRPLRPPAPVGQPYRGDPGAPSPFVREGDLPRAEAATPLPVAPTAQTVPAVTAPGPRSPEERFARTALWLGIASIFVFNLVIGPVAIVMGALAMKRGERRTGRSALLLGVLGTFIGVMLLVLVSAGVLPSVEEMLKDLSSRR